MKKQILPMFLSTTYTVSTLGTSNAPYHNDECCYNVQTDEDCIYEILVCPIWEGDPPY